MGLGIAVCPGRAPLRSLLWIGVRGWREGCQAQEWGSFFLSSVGVSSPRLLEVQGPAYALNGAGQVSRDKGLTCCARQREELTSLIAYDDQSRARIGIYAHLVCVTWWDSAGWQV